MRERSRHGPMVVAAAALIGFASLGAPALAGGLPSPTRKAAGVGCLPGSVHGLRTARLSYAAVASRPLIARPALKARTGMRFELRNVNGVTTVFGVLAQRVDGSCHATDFKVQLPIRPNGSTGWVRAADVRLRSVHTRIAVHLSKRQITLFRDGRAVLVTSAVIGAPSTPTPVGHYYVNQRLLTGFPTGDYGPGAVGISAFSPVLLHWPQGGPIAIHGTDAPGLIGFAVSHGCLRVRNVDATKLLQAASEGTPVEIRK